jgi:hypothetical protein
VHETSVPESRNLDPIGDGETLLEVGNGLSVEDLSPATTTPAWKEQPQTRLSLGNLNLGDEIVADREEKPDLLVSADHRKTEAADLEGLEVVNLSRDGYA